MQIYELTHPPYGTDRARDTANPIRMVDDVYLPGVQCPTCGQTWAGSRRLYLPVNDPTLRRRLRGAPLPLGEWRALAREVRAAAQVPSDFDLRPGDVLGVPKAEILSTDLPDFLHPFPGQVIVQDHVRSALQAHRFAGYDLVRLEAHWPARIKPPASAPPPLFEIVVSGGAWRVASGTEQITTCPDCGRRAFPRPHDLTVDAARWDGSDFFLLDQNPNIVLITQAVRQLLVENRYTNVACVAVSELERTHSRMHAEQT